MDDILYFSGNSSAILLKNFDNFPSTSFTIITVIKFDNLITNDIKKLATSYFTSPQREVKDKKKSFLMGEINDISDYMDVSEKNNVFIQTPEFNKKNNYRPTILTLKSPAADYFEIFINLEGGQTKLCLVKMNFLLI